MRIAIDVDDVIAQSLKHWIELYNSDYDDCLSLETITDWDLTKFVKCGSEIYEYLKEPSFYDGVVPIVGAQTIIRSLRARGHEIIFVSAGASIEKTKWLFEYSFINQIFPHDPCLVYASNKALINADMIIDDRASTVVRYPKGGIIFAQPWNDIKLWPLNVERVESWADIWRLLSDENNYWQREASSR